MGFGYRRDQTIKKRGKKAKFYSQLYFTRGRCFLFKWLKFTLNLPQCSIQYTVTLASKRSHHRLDNNNTIINIIMNYKVFWSRTFWFLADELELAIFSNFGFLSTPNYSKNQIKISYL